MGITYETIENAINHERIKNKYLKDAETINSLGYGIKSGIIWGVCMLLYFILIYTSMHRELVFSYIYLLSLTPPLVWLIIYYNMPVIRKSKTEKQRICKIAANILSEREKLDKLSEISIDNSYT